MKKLLPVLVAIISVVGGGAFYGGMKYAESKNPRGQFSQRFEGQANVGGFRQGRMGGQAGGGSAGGEIIAKDDKSITIKLRDGGSRIVFFSGSTEVAKSAKGSADDLKIGAQVAVNGTPNSDGSITASSIQVRGGSN